MESALQVGDCHRLRRMFGKIFAESRQPLEKLLAKPLCSMDS